MALNKPSLSRATNYCSILILPLLSLYISLRNFRRPEAKNLFWLFCIFLGMVHIFFPVGGSYADGVRYAIKLIVSHQQALGWNSFSQQLFTTKFVDLYQPVTTYLIGLFTDDPQWLFTVYAVVFGFFYSRNMWFLLDKIPLKSNFIVWVLVAFYFLICPIWEINGVRMWTALHIFAYGALPYVYEKDPSRLIWCFLTPFVHFSYINALGILLIYILLIPNRIIPLLLLFLSTFFMNDINMEHVKSAANFLPDFIQGRFGIYTTDAQLEHFKLYQTGTENNAMIRFSKFVSKWSMMILITYISIAGRKVYEQKNELKRLVCFSLFFYSVSNILGLIPSGARFIVVSQLFATASLVLFFVHTQINTDGKIRMYPVNTCILLLLAPILVQLRIGCGYYGISLLFNPMTAWLAEDHTPIILFFKMLFQ